MTLEMFFYGSINGWQSHEEKLVLLDERTYIDRSGRTQRGLSLSQLTYVTLSSSSRIFPQAGTRYRKDRGGAHSQRRLSPHLIPNLVITRDVRQQQQPTAPSNLFIDISPLPI